MDSLTYYDFATIKYQEVQTTVGSEGAKAPGEYSLSQNYPNPFNPKTDVRYEISPASLASGRSHGPEGLEGRGRADVGFVKLVVYDVLGREVAILVNEKKTPGRYSVTWDAASKPSGVYFYRLQAGDFTETRKLVLMR